MYKILVVEDDESILDIVCELLKEEGYEISRANNGKDGYDLFCENEYHLVITDIMMPILDGFQLTKLIRAKNTSVKILLLTALSEEYDELKGFEYGADDYVTKPFSFNVLLKRVDRLLKRDEVQVEQSVLTVDNIVLDRNTHLLSVDGEDIELTLKEFEIMRLLMSSVTNVVSRNTIIREVWGYEYFGDNRVVDTHIKNIRRKTGIETIKTISGVGYKLEQKQASQ